jgi:Xaa-Pro aminopeptidase
MLDENRKRTAELQQRLADENADLFLVADPDSIFYFAGCWGYLGMDFDRATLLLVPRAGDPVLITPGMEAEMCRAMTWVGDVREWTDGVNGEWMAVLDRYLENCGRIEILMEQRKTPAKVLEATRHCSPTSNIRDGTKLIAEMRMIKTPAEIAIMRQAGEIAVEMVKGGRAAIQEGVPEYELALAVIASGTRKAAEFLSDTGPDRLFSPTIYNLQVMQSGHETCMVHRRSTVKRLHRGDPIYFCFCGIANFKQFKLGFDREFFLHSATDEQVRTYETAVAAQQAALSAIRPGVPCEEVHAAAEDVYRRAGHGLSYRTGRGIGYSFLEEPQLKRGDKTPIRAGMTFAVDGGITVPGRFGARIGDSIVVTSNGFEYLTEYPRNLAIV